MMQSQEAAGRAGVSSAVKVGVLLTRARRGALSARGMRKVLADASLPMLTPAPSRRPGGTGLAGVAVCRAGRMPDAGPMIPMYDDQEGTRARACSG
jgi:hypothetical protein